MNLKEIIKNVENHTFVCYQDKEDKKFYYLCYQDKEFIEMDENRKLQRRNPIRAAEFLQEIYDSDNVRIVGKGQYGKKLDLSPFYI